MAAGTFKKPAGAPLVGVARLFPAPGYEANAVYVNGSLVARGEQVLEWLRGRRG